MLSSLGVLYGSGHPVPWENLYPEPTDNVRLPRYSWQRQRYWLDVEDRGDSASVSPGASTPTSRAKVRTDLLGRLDQAVPGRRHALLLLHVKEIVAKVLGRDLAALDVHLGFFQMGMTSLQAVELKNYLEGSFGRALPSTLAFENPTMTAVAAALLELEFGDAKVPDVPMNPVGISASQMEELSERELSVLLDTELSALEGLLE